MGPWTGQQSCKFRQFYDHAKGLNVCVCAYEGEWLRWSPAQTQLKEKSKAGECIWSKRDTWMGDKSGTRREGRQQYETVLLLCCCAPLMSSLIYPYLCISFLPGNYTSTHPTTSLFTSLQTCVCVSFWEPGSSDLCSLSCIEERTFQDLYSLEKHPRWQKGSPMKE